MKVSVKTNKKSGVNGYAVSALVLAGAGMVSKILGAVYRIPLTNLLGAEGIGLYQLVFPVYALMLTLSSSGIPTAIARMVSEKRALGEQMESRKIFKSAFILLFTLGSIATFFMLLVSSPLANLQGNINIQFGYYAVAPSVLIVACSAFFKGWFQGNMNMIPTAMAQICEQVFKMLFGLLFAYLLLPRGVTHAVVGALIGLTLSEFLSLCVMGGMYLLRRPKGINQVALDMATTKMLVKISLPMMASGLIFPITQFVDSLLTINLLALKGVPKEIAVAQYGILSAPVNSLINMPIVITLAFAVAIVPIISANRAIKNAVSIKQKSVLAVKLSFLIGAPFFVAIFVLSKQLMTALYPSLSRADVALASQLLQISSVSVILLSLSQIFTSLMQALGKSTKPIKILLFTAICKILLDVVLILHIGIVGASVASVVAYMLSVVIGWGYMRKLLGKDENLVKSISKITLCSAIIGLVIFGFTFLKLSNWWIILICMLVAVPLYVVIILATNVLSEQEIMSFPFGEKLSKINGFLKRKTK